MSDRELAPDSLRAVRGASPDITLGELAAASPSEAKPALLALARAHADRPPAALLDQWGRDGFVAPSPLDLRAVLRLDQLALAAADAFTAVLLSPVAPLGVCSALAPTSQDRTLSAYRQTEVVSDPTNCLALACAERLRRSPADVRLCTVHQVLRAQSFGGAGRTQHFRMFAMAEAGRGRAEDGFEVEAFRRQVGVFVDLIARCRDAGHPIGALRLRIFAAAGRAVLADRVETALAPLVADPVRSEFESAYYDGLRVMLDVDRAGEWSNLGDVGRFDWVARLGSNRKHRFVASGFGIQLVPLLFPAVP